MKVVCIDISPRGSIKGHQGLTLDKKYEVISDDALYFEVINDDGFKCSYRKIRFVSLDEFRESKLKKLGI